MGLRLEQVVPWGRSLSEYVQMFDLTEADLQSKILDCGSGPASFNAEMTQLKHSVISCDPIYQFSTEQIQQRISETYEVILSKVEATRENFVWSNFRSPEEMGQSRMASMQKFLIDFSTGLQQKRYQIYELPNLPFENNQFDLALCSHLLFLYSDQLNLEFHLASIIEMCRISTEVRIFPLLLNMTGETSPFLEPVMQTLKEQGYTVNLRQVPYEFQRGGNQMLQVKTL
ncbi:MAG: SAM-dependent methyltransferase [Plectolyngbya sp. WJT66-NPBG17]|jgi:SAM-dependent methyltransferase|nr:SAM-dependent methyltransferase [Plectolyngbya sp. WJT66-NPBG17]MBW4523687.1 SAM-dependent methyltransferase [Phormidium tanganyikae FI6-MK23]